MKFTSLAVTIIGLTTSVTAFGYNNNNIPFTTYSYDKSCCRLSSGMNSNNNNENNVSNNDFSFKALKQQFGSILLASFLVFMSPITEDSANAAVAPLADVGLREFLVKDGNELLRLSIPTSLPQTKSPEELKDTSRQIQEAVELVRLRLEQVGFSGKPAVWSAAGKEAKVAKSLLESYSKTADLSSTQQMLVKNAITKLTSLNEVIRDQDITSTLRIQEEVSDDVGQIRLLSMKPKTLPYKIPNDYRGLPRLKGRAIVECTIRKQKNNNFKMEDGTKSDTVVLTLTLDGYHAPLTAGNFVDLVAKKFYDGMFLKENGELVVQTPDNQPFFENGKKEPRTIPLELFYKGDSQPTYEYTSDEDMRATESFSLPFQAYGALGMEHDPEDVNSGSSQFWFLRWNQNLIAPGRNTLDGSHACFGYVTSPNAAMLEQIKTGDTIESMKVVSGVENLEV